MNFAKKVFLAAGVWGIAELRPLYFLFDGIGRQHASPITYPQFFYGFLAVTMTWQFAFLVIGSDPARFRLMMIPSLLERYSKSLWAPIIAHSLNDGLSNVIFHS